MNKKNATNFLKLFTFIALLAFFSCKETVKEINPEEPIKLPNIIYVLTDDLGYGDINTFNTESKIPTPHIDLLASEGMKFTDAHTSSAVCTPTRYGILTGRYNWRSSLKEGVLTGVSKALIPNNRATVASLLKKSGYTTGFIGKWHLGWDWALKQGDSVGGTGWNPTDYENIDFSKRIKNGPKDLGFEYSYGHSGSLDMAPYVYVENGTPTTIPKKVTVDTGKYTWWREGPTGDDFIHDDVTPNFFRKSFNFIQNQAATDKPFFLYLALPSPHTPILPTEEWLGKSDLNPYADFVMQIDDYMGKLTALLEEKGIADNTLVVFTSDNGCSPQADFDVLAEKGHDPSAMYRGHKADIYEGGHRVPFIVKWPAKIKAGRSSDKTICTTDFFATCAQIVGSDLNANEGEDSFSMIPLFSNDTAVAFMRETTIHSSINGSFAIRKGQFKLVMAAGSGGWSYPKPNDKDIAQLPQVQLFDLSVDPKEEKNLYLDKPEVVAELKELLHATINNGRSTEGLQQQNDANFDNKEWKQLAVFNDE
ncbi:arylsulfatase [Aurantibacter crassamenti]|uniref:sulfatase family protein n=1 Tax=Aurantibacter crassamenti TaxID=1837375 RepID=UPI00193A928E|nr:arylsulfatase [Aurantibacter crassamenti]MBM1106186.1 arylsulfatase [Aurantibacter crassamenti]